MCDFDFLLFNTENNQENIQFNLNGLNEHLSFDNNKNIVLNLINKENLDFFIFKSSLYNLDNFYDVDNYASVNDLSNYIINNTTNTTNYIFVNNEKEIAFINKKMPAHRIVFIGIFYSNILHLNNFILANKFDITLSNCRFKNKNLNSLIDFIYTFKNKKIIPLQEILNNPKVLNNFYINIIQYKYQDKNDPIIKFKDIFKYAIDSWKIEFYKINSKKEIINIISYILFKSEKFVISKSKLTNNRFIISFEELQNLLIAFDVDISYKELELILNTFNYVFVNYNLENQFYYVKNSFFISLFCYDYLEYKYKDCNKIIEKLFSREKLLFNSDQIAILIFINYNILPEKKFRITLKGSELFYLTFQKKIYSKEILLTKEVIDFLKNNPNIFNYLKEFKDKNLNKIINKKNKNIGNFINLIRIILNKYSDKKDTINNFSDKEFVITNNISNFIRRSILDDYYIQYSLNFNDFLNNFIDEFKRELSNSINDAIFCNLFIRNNLNNLKKNELISCYLNIFDNLKNKIFNLTNILTEEQQKKYYNNLYKLPKNFEEFLNIFDEINKNECKSEWFIENNFNYNRDNKNTPKEENHINKNISNLLKNKYQIYNTIESENNDKTRSDITLSDESKIIIECKGQWNPNLKSNNSEYDCINQLSDYLINNQIKYGVLLVYFFENEDIPQDKHSKIDNLENLKKYIDKINKNKGLKIYFKSLHFKNRTSFLSGQKLNNIFNFIRNNNFSSNNLMKELDIEIEHSKDIITLLKNNNLTENSGRQLKLISNHNLDENKFIELYNKKIK